MSIYEMETEAESSVDQDKLVYTASSLFTMTIGYITCAALIAVAINGVTTGWFFIFLSILKAVLLSAVMVLTASIIARTFETSFMRRINSLVLGMILGCSLVFFNL